MSVTNAKRRPGEVRDAIISVLSTTTHGASVHQIERHVANLIGNAARSSVRSYLRLNTPSLFVRTSRGHYGLRTTAEERSTERVAETRPEYWRSSSYGGSHLLEADCLDWLRAQASNSIHAVVTDPPYGLFEYSSEQQEKLRSGKRGSLAHSPLFDGTRRSPLPRFTIPSTQDLQVNVSEIDLRERHRLAISGRLGYPSVS